MNGSTRKEVEALLRARLPKGWFTGPPRIDLDPEEIMCVGPVPEGTPVEEWRETTRSKRVAIAAEVEARFRRKVSWGVQVGDRTVLFTNQSTPVMTRLRLPERAVLDTLIDAGVARSRSEALAWCVRLVGRHQAEWLADLRGALADVQRIRAEGPTLI